MGKIFNTLVLAAYLASAGCAGLKGRIQNDPVSYLQTSSNSNYAATSNLKAKIQKNCEAAKGYDICLTDNGEKYVLRVGKLKDAEKGIFEDGPLTQAFDENKDGRIDGISVGSDKYLAITKDLMNDSKLDSSETLTKLEQLLLNDSNIEWKDISEK